MLADIEQTMGYTGEAEAFLRVTCGDLCETAWFPLSDKVSDQMVDKIISTINTQTADEIERLRRVEMIAREISIDVKNVIYNHHDELASTFLCDLAIAELAKRLAKLKAALDNG